MKVGNYETLYDKLWLRKRDKSVTACNIPTLLLKLWSVAMVKYHRKWKWGIGKGRGNNKRKEKKRKRKKRMGNPYTKWVELLKARTRWIQVRFCQMRKGSPTSPSTDSFFIIKSIGGGHDIHHHVSATHNTKMTFFFSKRFHLELPVIVVGRLELVKGKDGMISRSDKRWWLIRGLGG